MIDPGLSRRSALTGAVGIGVGLPVLAACGDDGGSATAAGPGAASGAPGTPSGPDGSDLPTGAATPTEAATQAGTGAATPAVPAAGFASTADIPVGVGTVFVAEELVVTQPTAGEFKAFSRVCTHSGCPVDEVTDTINCPCHGSRFSLTDGAPAAGPAADPLTEIALTIEGDQISLA